MPKARISGHQLLLQPTIWISNTAAIKDMTPHALRMVGEQKPKEMVSVVIGNKQVKKSVAIGDIPGIVCNNHGNQKFPVKMSNIALVPDCAFNLFSISKRLKQGWTLGGNC